MSDKIVTNIRMDRDDWMMVKAMAAANNMSFNEYINFLARDLGTKSALAVDWVSGKKGKGKMDLRDFSRKVVKNEKPMGLGGDDELIYG